LVLASCRNRSRRDRSWGGGAAIDSLVDGSDDPLDGGSAETLDEAGSRIRRQGRKVSAI